MKKPVCKLIGGSFRETIPLGPAAVPGVTTPIEEMVAVAKEAYERGSRSIKVKVGADVDVDVKRIKALREALGDDVKLIVDANQGWTPKMAIKTINRMNRYDLHIAEQPVAFWDLKGMAYVRKNVEPLIMADESLGCEWDASNIIRHEAADLFYMYVTKSPGIYNTMKIIAIGEPAGVSCWIFGGGVLSLVATLHVCAAAKNTGLGEAMFQPAVLGWVDRREFLAEPLKVSPKGVEVPKGPGLGVDLDWEKVEKYRRRT